MSLNTSPVIWITGASSGIGEALALQYAANGARVVLSARRTEILNQVKQRCIEQGADSGDILVLPLDITNQVDIDESIQALLAFSKRIDLLINNAGISQRSSCLTTDMSTYRALFDVDVFGQIALTKAVLPIMLEQGSGHIAVMSSVSGKVGVPFRTGYCAAKHAVMGFFDALRSEVAHQNIKVTTITPGFIRTNVSKNALKGDGSAFAEEDEAIAGGMAPDACARVIIKGLDKAKYEVAVGHGVEMHVLWIKRFFPNFLIKIMEKQYQKRAKEYSIK